MLRNCIVAAGILLALFPAAASAQDNPHHGFTGLRVEGLAGYDNASFDSVRSGDGLLYGVGVGYDLGSGRLRFGLEAEASGSTVRDCQQFAGTRLCSTVDRDLYVGVRAGGLISPNVLLYAKGGYTNLRETNRFTLAGGGTPLVFHPKADGFRLGAGAEIAVGAKSYIKAEYRFSLYERSDSFDSHQGVIGFGFRF